jgi:hypothetical protein
MPRIPRAQQAGFIYHVINRENGRATIFHKAQDYQAFLSIHRHCAASQARLGALVGLDYTAVSRERKRLRDRVESDKGLHKRLVDIEVSVLS